MGLSFLSSSPLPVLPLCVLAEEPEGHPWHPYSSSRVPLAKSRDYSVCAPCSSFVRWKPVLPAYLTVY